MPDPKGPPPAVDQLEIFRDMTQPMVIVNKPRSKTEKKDAPKNSPQERKPFSA